MAVPNVANFKFYVFFSVLLSAAVLSHAIYTKKFFFRTVVYLYRSKLAVMCAANMALVSVLLIWRLTQLIFLGPLRFRELERLHHRARDAIIEYCFAISVFREDFNPRFVALIMTVLLLKSLHWLAKDRTDFLEEQLRCPLRTHIRLVGLLMLLAFVDCFLAVVCIQATLLSNGRSMYVLFSFEFTLLVIELAANVFQYIFFLIDQQMDGRWGSKGVFSFYAELLCDLSTLTVYIVFFIYVQIYYSFPYHIIREFYVTLSKFQRKVADFLRYRRVVANMHEVVDEVTADELEQGDRTCIICREEMESAVKLSCGHMFHRRCLENWLKRQLSCPTCRATIDVNRGARNQASNANQNANANQQRAANARDGPPAISNEPQRPPQAAQQAGQRHQQQPRRQQAGQPGAQNANIGEAGARLLNFANQWINQVMNEGGIRPQANAQNANVPNANNAQANHHHHHHHHHHHRHQANLANLLQAQNRQAGAPPNAQQAQRQNANALLNFHPGVPGPNAIAHMQLRARRRGAYAGLRQYAPMYRVHLPPLNNAANAMMNNAPNQANAATQGAAAANGLAAQGGAQGDANVRNQPNAPQQGAANSSGAAAAAGSSSSSANYAYAPILTATASGLSGNVADSHTARAAQGGLAALAGAATQAGLVNAQGGVGASAQALPLERLFEIQRQIEILRSEVQSLVLHATEAQLSAMESEERQNSGEECDEASAGEERGAAAGDASAAAAVEGEGGQNVEAEGGEERGEGPAVAGVDGMAESVLAAETGEDGRGEGQSGGDSEAERMRRRRIEFLERTSRS